MIDHSPWKEGRVSRFVEVRIRSKVVLKNTMELGDPIIKDARRCFANPSLYLSSKESDKEEDRENGR